LENGCHSVVIFFHFLEEDFFYSDVFGFLILFLKYLKIPVQGLNFLNSHPDLFQNLHNEQF